MEKDFKKFFSWLFDKENIVLFTEFDIATEETIFYPEEIKKLIETDQMQRLKKIMQLSTVICDNETAYHTRYDHSLGTFHNGVLLYKSLYEDPSWKKENEDKKLDIQANLIELLTHDIGHLTFSHTLEMLIGKRGAHEVMSERIILGPLKPVIEEINPELINIIRRHKENENYSNIKEGNIDLDRMDYLVHDSIYLDESDDKRNLMKRLLLNMKVVSSENLEDVPVFPEESIGDVVEFLNYRTNQYRKYYNSNVGLTMDTLCIELCKRAYQLGKLPEDFYKYVNEAIQDKTELSLDTHLAWTDLNTINSFIEIIENSDDENLVEFTKMCTPSFRGLINILYKMTDFPKENEGELEDGNPAEKRLYDTLKKYIKSSDLTPREQEIKRDLAIDSQFKSKLKVFNFEKDQYEQIRNQLVTIGLEEDLIDTLIWKRKIKKYSPKDPTYIERLDGSIIELSKYDDFKMDLSPEFVQGGFYCEPYLKVLNIDAKKIEEIKTVFDKYKQDPEYLNIISPKRKSRVSRIAENEDIYYRKYSEEIEK